MAENNEATRSEANRLYWETDISVADIAATLEVSRRALYNLIEPLPSETPCTECGSLMVFANRLSRANGIVVCPGCAHEQNIAEQREAAANAGPALRSAAAPEQTERPRRRLRLFAQQEDRTARIGAFALLGLAVGAIVTIAITRNE